MVRYSFRGQVARHLDAVPFIHSFPNIHGHLLQAHPSLGSGDPEMTTAQLQSSRSHIANGLGLGLLP